MAQIRNRSVMTLSVGLLGLVAVAMLVPASCSAPRESARAGGSSPSAKAPVAAPAPTARLAAPLLADDAPRDYVGIHNAVAFHDGVISGSVPEGDAGFASLAAMGVTTIISVDGSVPDVARAKALGMRYIHLPIGYNGFDETRKLELTRATRDALANGPVYIHCHHGKHRSAGAAGAVAVSLGWMTPDAAVARMKVSGTAPNYTGLYASASEATVVAIERIDAVSPDFPEISPPGDFVQGMVDIDEVFEDLKAIEKAGWRVPADHPDLVPASEAGRLADLFRVHNEGDDAKARPADFFEWMESSTADALAMESMFSEGRIDSAALATRMKSLAVTCKACHAKYRD